MHPKPFDALHSAARAPSLNLDRALDLAERAMLLLALGWFVARLAPDVTRNPIDALIVLSEGFVVLMVVVRRFGPISASPIAWLAAIVGTFPPLFVEPTGEALIAGEAAGPLMAAGLLLSVSAKLCLNRRFGIVAANRGVAYTGPYRFVRHPMYLGYALTHAGFVLLHPVPWNGVVYAVTWSAMVFRIHLEEGFLRRDPAYQAYAATVRYRLVPGLF